MAGGCPFKELQNLSSKFKFIIIPFKNEYEENLIKNTAFFCSRLSVPERTYFSYKPFGLCSLSGKTRFLILAVPSWTGDTEPARTHEQLQHRRGASSRGDRQLRPPSLRKSSRAPASPTCQLKARMRLLRRKRHREGSG